MTVGKIQQILLDIKLKIRTGQWQLGFRLPTQRELATQYQVNRSTIVSVIEELMADGLVETRGRQGTFVINQSWSLLASQSPKHWGESIEAGFHQANQPLIQKINTLEFEEKYIRLGTGELSPKLYPKALMAEAFSALGDTLNHLGYECPLGSIDLRIALCEYLKTHGIKTSPECVLIVSGSLQALSLISVGLMSRAGCLFTEKPSYVKSLNTFQSVGINLSGVPMDQGGIRLDKLLEAMSSAKTQEKVLYTVPTFHNPTGSVMSEKRREDLMAFALKYSLPIIEDDAYRELWLDKEAPLPLKARDAFGNVLYMGTFSKTLAAGLRIGWLVGPQPVIERLGDIKMQMDYGASSVSQALACHLLTSGSYAHYIQSLREEMRRRRALVLSFLKVNFSDLATWQVPAGGFYIWLKLNKPLSMNMLFKKALSEHLLINPGDIYDYEHNPYLRLSYAYADLDDLEAGISTLAKVVRALFLVG